MNIKCGCCEPGCAQCGTDLNLARLSPHGYRTAKTDPQPIPLPCPHHETTTSTRFVKWYGNQLVTRCKSCGEVVFKEWA